MLLYYSLLLEIDVLFTTIQDGRKYLILFETDTNKIELKGGFQTQPTIHKKFYKQLKNTKKRSIKMNDADRKMQEWKRKEAAKYNDKIQYNNLSKEYLYKLVQYYILYIIPHHIKNGSIEKEYEYNYDFCNVKSHIASILKHHDIIEPIFSLNIKKIIYLCEFIHFFDNLEETFYFEAPLIDDMLPTHLQKAAYIAAGNDKYDWESFIDDYIEEHDELEYLYDYGYSSQSWDLDLYHAMIEYTNTHNIDLYTFYLNILAIPEDIRKAKSRIRIMYSSINDFLKEFILDHPIAVEYDPSFIEQFLPIKCRIRRIEYKQYGEILYKQLDKLIKEHIIWGPNLWEV